MVRNCNVITTPLSPNEKKVLLYSANLQVRGGFSDESVRRKAIAEFIACLQEEPYNMSREEALGAIKSVSSVNPRTIERDARIEDKLEGTLKELLNAKFLTRSECENYLRFEEDKQQEIADRFDALSRVECYGDTAEGAGKNHIEVMRDSLHDAFREYLFDVQRQGTTKEYEAAYIKAVEYFDNTFNEFKTKAEEYGEIKQNSTPDEVAAVDYAEQIAVARDVAQKEHSSREKSGSMVQRTTPRVLKRLNLIYTSKTLKEVSAMSLKNPVMQILQP